VPAPAWAPNPEQWGGSVGLAGGYRAAGGAALRDSPHCSTLWSAGPLPHPAATAWPWRQRQPQRRLRPVPEPGRSPRSGSRRRSLVCRAAQNGVRSAAVQGRRGAMNTSRVPGLTRNSGWAAAMAAARQCDQVAEPVRDDASTRPGSGLSGWWDGPASLTTSTRPLTDEQQRLVDGRVDPPRGPRDRFIPR
jgi:hypothetical protein